MKLPVVSTWISARAAKEKLAGARENSVGIEALKSPVAATRGVSLLNDRGGTRGRVIAMIVPMLQDLLASVCSGMMNATYTAHNPNMKKMRAFLVNQLPHKPVSPRFQAFHFSCRFSLLISRRPDLVMFIISDFCHSGPSAGTVTSSTGARALLLSPSILAPGGGGTGGS